jgi:predicted HicB family RNase H-like nuclease
MKAKTPTEEYSGKLVLRMPKQLHADLAAAAEREGMSLNSYLVYLLAERNARRQARKK